MKFRKVFNQLVLFLLLANVLAGTSPARGARSSQAADQAAAMLARLTPEERVGQLFLVTFQGTEAGEGTPIYELITRHHIGGVVLLAEKDNFTAGEQALEKVQGLVSQLQLARWSSSDQETPADQSVNEARPAFIPLFISLPQEGDGPPYDQIINGLTSLPNEMAIGATWSPDKARQVGAILGGEISALGVNMLIGPSLDVLEEPHSQEGSDLGTRTFGGDPFWVSEMGKAYIQGVHAGSSNKVAVIATHFPGHGSSDRLPEDEVATVRKSLEQLKSFDLQPFFNVTGSAPSPDMTAEGLLAAHIRYQGFQGNFRGTTRPVSFDPQAFKALLDLPQIDTWRKNGGLIVSDDLGGRAVRRFYELTSQDFDARRVTLNALIAGNDLLYVGDFSSTSDTDQLAPTIRTLDFFAQKYREDTAFQQRVDESVLRILTLKFKLYPDFSIDQVLPQAQNLSGLGTSGQVAFEVARRGATLISPNQVDLDETMPDPPGGNDRIVFITDVRTAKQCSLCPAQPLVDREALQTVVLRRYGPTAGGQVGPNNLSSFSLADLQQMLDLGRGDSDIERDLNRAHWVVFSLLNPGTEDPSYAILSRFLSERPDLFQRKRLIVFAFSAPYYLDATDLSKINAFYALYSKTPQFVDMAAYLLFRELPPSGASPVSVPGVSYDLNTALFPNPNNPIPLELDISQTATPTGTVTPAPLPTFVLGDVIPLRTGVILDHNANPVPDGTPVEFSFTVGDKNGRQVEYTKGGVARTTYLVANAGTLEISAQSDLAKSAPLRFDIPLPNGEMPTATFTPTPTPTVTPTPQPTATLQPGATPAPPPPPNQPQFADWVMALLVSAGAAWAAYRLSALIGQVRWGVRSGFLVLIGGLVAYSYLALKLPGSDSVIQTSVSRGVLLTTLVGITLGLLGSWVWRSATEAGPGEKTN